MKKTYSFSFLFFCISFSHATTVLVTDLSEFNTAVGNAIPGDTIKMKDGTWTDIQLEFYANGTAVKPIVLMAETPGNVLITGSSTLSIWGEYLVVRDLDFSDGQSVGTKSVIQFRKDSNNLANNCRLTNTRILDFNPVSSSTNYKWVSIYGKNNRVDHCHFAGKNHQGALLTVWLDGQPDYHRIDHNYFSDIPDLGENGGKTIRIGTSTYSMTDSYTTVEYNLFESCDGEIEIISNKSGFNVSRYNTFRNNNGMLTLRQGNDCEVYGNFFFGSIDKSSGGVRIIGERHKVYNNYFQDLNQGLRSGVSMMNGVPDSPLNRYFQVKNAQVVNNTFVGCQESIAIGEGSDSERTLRPLDCIIANNAIQGTTRGKAIVYTDTPINMTYEANYIERTIGVTDPELINTDPNLILTDGVWRPNAQSIVVGNATSNYPYVSNDMDGQSRDSNPDVGADEVSSATVTIVPLEKEDIGYNWTDPITPEVLSALNAIRSDIKLLVKNGTMTISGLEDSDFQRYLVSIPWMESTSRQIPFNQSCNFESAFRTLYHQTFK